MELAKLVAQYLSSLGTIILGAVVAYIAWRQYRTSHDKLRLDLFERRHAIYRALMNFLLKLDPDASKSGDRIRGFLADTNDACFLFGKDVVDFLSEVYGKATRHRHIILNLQDRNPSDHEKYKQWFNEETELLEWFDGQMARANEVFAPYLTFKDRSP